MVLLMAMFNGERKVKIEKKKKNNNIKTIIKKALLLPVAGVYLGFLQHDLTRMADKADASIVLAQMQVSFLWECDN